MILKTYNPETLEEKETVTKLTSVIWNNRFYDVGSFEIHTTENVFSVGDLLAYSYNGVINCGIIMKIHETKTDLSITGNDLKGLLNFRYITSLVSYSDIPAETIIKNLADTFFMTGDRTVEKLLIKENQGRGNIASFSSEKTYLNEALKTFCQNNEIGISLDFDFNNLIFDVKFGADRSDTIKFGRAYRNIENVEYTKDLFNTYNVCYSSTKNEDDTETEIVEGYGAGILRRECYSDSNPAEYLKEKAESETLRADANERYVYGKDYFLGDYVTIEHNMKETTKQITEIKEIHEQGKHQILPIFGTEKENVIKKIMRGV